MFQINQAIHHSDAGLYMPGVVGFTGLFGNSPDQVIANHLLCVGEASP